MARLRDRVRLGGRVRAQKALSPSSPMPFWLRYRWVSFGSAPARIAAARAHTPASPMLVSVRERHLSARCGLVRVRVRARVRVRVRVRVSPQRPG